MHGTWEAPDKYSSLIGPEDSGQSAFYEWYHGPAVEILSVQDLTGTLRLLPKELTGYLTKQNDKFRHRHPRAAGECYQYQGNRAEKTPFRHFFRFKKWHIS